mgnify:CR=1 FL=1
MEILCSLDNIQFPITKYEIKNKEIKLEILFDTNKYKGVFEQLEIKCIPLLFDKYKDTILQLKIYSDIYQVKCKDCEFFRPNIHTDLEKYRKHLFNIYSKIMNDPSWIVAQHMKGFENLHLDDVDKKKDIVNVSGTIIFEIVNSLEAIEKLRIRHEQEAQQCIEIFRSFCQWYQSQYNFEQIESTFWNACIYLIEKQKCRIDEKFSEALLQLLVLFQSFRINHRLKRYTKILQGLYWRTAIPYYF